MNILIGHNYYSHRGGEDVVFERETELLKQHGHSVTSFTRRNDLVNVDRALRTGISAIWSTDSRREVTRILKSERFDLAHFHNTFPLFSASVYAACKDAGVPVVQTLHNFRWLCPAATLFRDGHVCEECLSCAIPTAAVRHRCYHGNRWHSLAVAAMLTVNHAMGNVTDMVDLFVAPTSFLRDKFVEYGFPGEKFVVKPSFVPSDPGQRTDKGDYVLYLGRLSEEKGIRTLLKAWDLIGGIPLRVTGDGPLRGEVEDFISRRKSAGVAFDGFLDSSLAMDNIKKARFLVSPSECYEVFSNVIVEAFSCGVTVVAPSHGAAAELIEDGVTGVLFRPGDSQDLAEKMELLWSDSDRLVTIGANARKKYLEKYTAESNYGFMMDLYGKVASQGRSNAS